MTYLKAIKYVRAYGFMSFAKKFGSKYGKKYLNKGILSSKRIKTVAKKLMKVNLVKC